MNEQNKQKDVIKQSLTRKDNTLLSISLLFSLSYETGVGVVCDGGVGGGGGVAG